MGLFALMIPTINSAFATEGPCWIQFSTCPGNQSIESCAAAAATYTAIADHIGGRTDLDASNPVSYSYSFTGATSASGSGTGSGSTFQPGTTTVNVFAKGTGTPCENIVCTFTVKVQCPPCFAPDFVDCPTNISQSNDAGICGGVATYTPTVSGSTGTYSYVFSGATSGSGSGTGSGSTFNVGVTTVTITYTNACGTDDCIFTVTINDTENPTISCPGNQNRDANTGIKYTVSGTEFDPTATGDNCGIASVINNFNNSSTLSGAVFNPVSTIVTWTITDIHSNTSTCSFVVDVNCGAGLPSGANVFTASPTITISTQTQMDAFYATSGANTGKKFTKIIGSITVDGNHATDPVTNLCNLTALTEVTGTVLIANFKKAGNPTDLSQLANLKTIGCNFTVNTNPKLLAINLPNIETLGCSLYMLDNVNAVSIRFPKLRTVKGDRIAITGNLRAEKIILSDQSSSYRFIGKGSVVDVSNNGGSTSNPLTIRMRKLTYVNGSFTFNNNNNSGVVNFDSIFGGLDTIKYGMIVTNNPYLNKCCIVATTMVTGGRTISGNTGNCATSAAVLADCGAFSKRSLTPSGNMIDINGVSVNVYPSPNKGKFGIDVVSADAGTVHISIVDLMGRQVYSINKEISGTINIPVNLDQTAEGQYIVKTEINGVIDIKRIFVVK